MTGYEKYLEGYKETLLMLHPPEPYVCRLCGEFRHDTWYYCVSCEKGIKKKNENDT